MMNLFDYTKAIIYTMKIFCLIPGFISKETGTYYTNKFRGRSDLRIAAAVKRVGMAIKKSANKEEQEAPIQADP